MAAECILVDLYPHKVTLEEPGAGKSHLVYKVSGFTESGVHSFHAVAGAIAPAMTNAKIDPVTAQKVGKLVGAMIGALDDGKVTFQEALQIALQMQGL